MREKFESRIQLVTAETKVQKQKLEVAFHTFEQIKRGHSFQSLTGQVPAAAERLMPTLADIAGQYDHYDTISTCTDVTCT